MAKVTLTLTGMEQLQRALVRAPVMAKAYVGDVVSVTSFSMASRARSKVRKRSGRLSRAIVADSRALNGRVGIVSSPGREGDPAIYWRFPEFGTIRMQATPYIRPAADQEADDYIRRLRAIGSKLEQDLSVGRNL